MRLHRKLIIAIASILVAGGLVLSFIAWAGSGFDFMRLSTSNSDRNVTREESFEASKIDAIEISIEVDDMKVQTSKDGKIHLRYTDRDNSTYTLTNEGGVLNLTQRSKNGGWFNFDLFSFVNNQESDNVLLEIPADFDGDLNFSSDVGDMDIRKVSLTGAVDCKIGTGGFEAEDLTANSVTAQSDVGDVEGDGWSVAQYVSLSSNTGDVSLENSRMRDLTCHSDVGGIYLEGVAAGTGDLSTQTGDVKLKALDAKKLTVTTDVGSVTGSIDGAQTDYTIFTDADVGDSNVKGQLGAKDYEINISTEVGDIDLTFLR